MHHLSLKQAAARSQAGVTRLDVLFSLASLLWLGCVVLPVLAAVKPDAHQMECINHLKQLGTAFNAWATEHGNRMPWRVSAKDGGTHDIPGNGNAWVHLAWLSNHLDSPKLLACPADSIKPASTWSRDPEGGFLHQNHRGNAVSYFIGIDVHQESPRSFLSGDGNLEPSARSQSCDQANVKSAASLAPDNEEVQWSKAVHQEKGNVLQLDGTVLPTTGISLRLLLPDTGAVHEDNHVLLPR